MAPNNQIVQWAIFKVNANSAVSNIQSKCGRSWHLSTFYSVMCCSFMSFQLRKKYKQIFIITVKVVKIVGCSKLDTRHGWQEASYSKKKAHHRLHTMPGWTSTSSALPVKRTTTGRSNSHSRVQNWWSIKLLIAKFCRIANIRGEICKHIKSQLLASKLL